MIYWPQKDPAVSLVYGLNWQPSLHALGADETIADSDWMLEEGSVDISDFYVDATITGVRISGGANGEEQILRNTITTNNGNVLTSLCYMLVKTLG